MRKFLFIFIFLPQFAHAGVFVSSAVPGAGIVRSSYSSNGNILISSNPFRGGPDITTGLINYWKLDEISGATAVDSAGTNTGTLTNTPAHVPGLMNNGILYQSAASRYIALASIPIGNSASAFTIHGFFKDGGVKDNVYYGEASTSAGNPLLLAGNNQAIAGDFICERRDDALGDCVASSLANTWNDNKWHQFACVIVSKSSMTLWLDGAIQNTCTTALGTITMDNARLGSLGRLGGGFTDGSHDQQRLYNRVLNNDEILELKKRGI